MPVKFDCYAPVQPLAAFYARAKVKLPSIEVIAGDEVPTPYHDLLVHNGDMTPTLEKHYQDGIHLRLLNTEHDETLYSRNVVLLTDRDNKPVEFGAIRIHLDLFPARGRDAILEGHKPLGGILRELKLPHRSSPKAYFRLSADAAIRTAFGIRGRHVLYGRCNTLWNARDQALAEIVEILPPAK